MNAEMICKVILEIVLAVIGFLTTGVVITSFRKKEILTGRAAKTILWGIGLAAALAAGMHNALATAILVLFFAFTAIMTIGFMEAKEEKSLAVNIGKLLGYSGTIAIVANVVLDIVFRGFGKGKMLYWLIGPGLYYLSLTVYSRSLVAKKKKRKVNFDFALPLALTVIFTGAIVSLIVFMNVKGVIK